jgi:hypothetical protein
MMRNSQRAFILSVLTAATMLAAQALPGQGRGNSGNNPGNNPGNTPVKTTPGKATPAAKAKARSVTPAQAVIVTREVLVSNGYQIVQVKPVGNTQVIYYRRGSMGRGRGLGPVQQIVVVPSGSIVTFRSLPETLGAIVLRRLGLL